MGQIEIKSMTLGMVATNCYLIINKENKEALLVDPADNALRISNVIEENGCTLKAILLTHGHYDHILAVEDVKKEYQIPVYACEKEAGTLLDPSANLSGYGNRSCSLKADILLEDLQAFEAAGFSVQMLHTPGHTPGSCCYYLKDEGILFSGDTLFYGSVGRTDFPGGSTAQIVESLHRLTDSLPEETEVYPGHDISTTIGYEKRYNPFV